MARRRYGEVTSGSGKSCAVLRRIAVCTVLRDGADGERSETTALCDRNVSFQPARNIPSLCWCLPPVPPASAKQGDRDCYFLFRQNVCTSGSSSMRKQHVEAAAAAAAAASSKQQQAAASSSKQQAAASSKQQQAAASSR